MIRFNIELTAVEFDADDYKKRVQLNIEREVKTAAAKWLQAVLRAIPTFNPPISGIASERSTGFVAGAFSNLKLALGSIGGFGAGGPTGFLPGGKKKAPVGLIPILHGSKGEKLPFHEAQVISSNLFAQHIEARAREHPSEHSATSATRHLTREVIRNGKRIKVRIGNDFYTGGGGKVLKTPRSGAEFATQPENVFKIVGKVFTFNYSVDIDYFTIQDVKNIGRSRFAPWKAFEAGDKAFTDYLFRDKVQKIFPAINEFFVKKIYKVDSKGGISINRVTTGFQK